MRKRAFLLAALFASGCLTPPGEWFEPRWITRTAFVETCIPVVLDGASVEDIAQQTKIERVEVPGSASSETRMVWQTPIGGGKIEFLSQTSCRLSVGYANKTVMRKDDPAELRQQALDALVARGIDMGQPVALEVEPAPPAIVNCSYGAPAYTLLTFSTGAEDDRRRVLIMTLSKQGEAGREVCEPHEN